jgi:hypothetical protein
MAEADTIYAGPTTHPQLQSREDSVLVSLPTRNIPVSRHADLEVTRDNDREIHFEHDAED